MANNDAKQFSAFSALKGYNKMLELKENIVSSEINITEEKKVENAYKLNELKKGAYIKITYSLNGEYFVLDGIISKVNKEIGYIVLSGMKIEFEDIIDI